MSSALLFALSACATNRGARTQVDDATITTKIQSKLIADPETNPFEIGVDTVNGVVRLSGYVDEPGDRTEAEKLARDTAGVERVINDIEIGDLSLGTSVSDAALTSRVKTRLLRTPDTSGLNIDVDTDDGVVTLFGMVNTDAERQRALDVVRRTQGVQNVKSRLQVKTQVGERPE